jgi:acyl carrier protein
LALDSLPLTPHGKLDRTALPAPEARAQMGLEAPWVPPREGCEARLAAIWQELLGVDRVGAADDFFALGGHSLLASRVVARIRVAFGVELPLVRLFEKPTIASLTAEIERLPRLGGGPGDRAAEPSPAPATPAPKDARLAVDELSDAEVEAMLRDLLAERSGGPGGTVE